MPLKLQKIHRFHKCNFLQNVTVQNGGNTEYAYGFGLLAIINESSQLGMWNLVGTKIVNITTQYMYRN